MTKVTYNSATETSDFEGFDNNSTYKDLTGASNSSNLNSIFVSKDNADAYSADHDFNFKRDKGSNVINDNMGVTSATKNKIDKTLRYQPGDMGPFRVIVELIKEDKYINKLSVGRIFKNNNLGENLIDIKKTGKRKVTVYLETYESANNLLNSSVFEPNYNLYLPIYFVTVKGVIKGIPLDITVEDFRDEIDTNLEIVDIYRMHRFVNSKREPTDKICISFRSSLLPRYIKACYVRSKVEPYVPRVVYCEKCLRFNHRSNNCKGKQKCTNCCKLTCESLDSNGECQSITYCQYCKQNHKCMQVNVCKEINKQKDIKYIMATRALSYAEVMNEIDYFMQNKFSVLDPDSEPVRIYEDYSRNRNIINKTHKTITRIASQPVSWTNKLEKEVVVNSRKRTRTEEEANGVAISNPHKVSEYEKTINDLQLKIKNSTKIHSDQLNMIVNHIGNKQNLAELISIIKNWQELEILEINS